MNFFKNFSIYGLVPVISKSISFLLIPVYTKHLSISEYGIQDVFTVFKNLLVFFIVLEIYSGVGRYFYEYDEFKDRRALISSALIFQFLTSCIVTLVLVLFHDKFYHLLIGEVGYENVYWVVVAWIPLAGFIGFLSVVIRYEKKAKEFLYITIFQLLVRVSVTIYLIVKLKYGILGIFIGHFSGSIIASLGYTYLLKKYLKFEFNKGLLIKVLKYAIPLVPGLLVIGFEPNITRYLIRIHLSNVELGYFSFAITIVSIYAMVGTALRMTWEPFFFENSKKAPQSLNKKVLEIFNFFFFWLISSSLLISLFSIEIVELIARPEYLGSSKLIGLLALSAVLTVISQIASIGINYVNKTIIKSNINITSVLIIVIFIFLFLKSNGLMVIPYAFITGAIFRLLMFMYYTNKFMGLKFQIGKNVFLVIVAILVNILIIKFPISLGYKVLIVLFLAIIIFFKRGAIILTFKKINS